MLPTEYPFPSSPAASAVMRGNARTETSPERALRSALFRCGLRFRKYYPIVTALGRVRVDIAFPRKRVVIFLDGCFWHSCPVHGTKPGRNSEYWTAKLARNAERDSRNTEMLEAEGWKVVRIWEHEPIQQASEMVMTRLRAQS